MQMFQPANEKQKAFMESVKRYLLLSGAVGAGKSVSGCSKGFMINLLFPGSRGLICRKELTSLKSSTLVTLFEKVLPPDCVVKYNSQDQIISHTTPVPGVVSTICLSGLEKKADQSYPTKIGSTEYTWIFADETIEFSEDDFQVLTTRLRHKVSWANYLKIKKYYGFNLSYEEYNNLIIRQFFGATNPDSPNHYLYKFFFENKSDDRELFLTTPYDNPYLGKEYIEALEKTLTGVRRDRLLHGKWVQAEGAIYPMFSFDKNVIKIDLVRDMQKYKYFFAGADSNFPIPRAGCIFGVTADGQKHLIDEFYQESASVEKLGEFFSNFATHYKCTINVFHDPSDPEAIERLKKFPGVTCMKAMNSVLPGISEVSRVLEDGSFKISDKCSQSIKFLTNYKWKKGGEEQPEKVDDHLPDAIRYALFTYANEKKVSFNYMTPQFM